MLGLLIYHLFEVVLKLVGGQRQRRIGLKFEPVFVFEPPFHSERGDALFEEIGNQRVGPQGDMFLVHVFPQVIDFVFDAI